ncbi:TIGR03758 family integrating conjugative element protein [Halomonas huangheensis]|uniref:Integrating conjugative element protein n=1 Tax=Halomonas huangheensis TaxID=1178482 RepID=W1NAF9_9GAMM|nr:TIGR03758 family integrating conjugative element protein [Halomonas huangheensis]ALM54099.1 hypothetical protein AR456_18825 [Halomonas huangheensis]ERL52509.1 hypothetical protein BJB45_08125 [Halomonas huangheensis]
MASSTQAAFEAGAGASSNEVYLLIAAIGCSIAVAWLVWLCVSNWRGWASGAINEYLMTWNFIRGVMAVVILFWLFL